MVLEGAGDVANAKKRQREDVQMAGRCSLNSVEGGAFDTPQCCHTGWVTKRRRVRGLHTRHPKDFIIVIKYKDGRMIQF
jgi:hypothetical protein